MQNLRRFGNLQCPVFIISEKLLTGRSSVVTNNYWVPSRNAGHSKWANIRHTKGAKDLERSKQITKFNSRILVAIKDGGSADPKMNSNLNNLIQEAKNAKLPMSSILKSIESITKTKPQDQSQSEIWPVKGPGSSVILVEIFTDNRNRVKNDLNYVLKKNKGVFAESSAVKMFECNGIIRCTDFKGNPPVDEFLEECTDHAIEAGANDVTIQEDPEHGIVYEFTTVPSGIHKIKHFLTNLGYNCVYNEVVYTPMKRIELDDSALQSAAILCNKLMEHPEVVNVYDNIS